MTDSERQAHEAEGSSRVEVVAASDPSGPAHSLSSARPFSRASPILMVGAERSGSTLLRLMLDHHPEIAFERELDPAVAMISDDGAFPPLEEYVEWLGTVRDFDCPIDPDLDFVSLLDSFLQQGRPFAAVKPHAGAALHHHFDRALAVWPKARFLHLIRDPRDVAPSIVAKGWAGNLYAGTGFWVDAEQCWERLEERLEPGQFIEVRFEDLITAPEEELARICEWVGVSFHPQMLEYSATAPQYPKPDPRHAQRWKRELAFHQVHQVEVRAASLMASRGYKPVDPSPQPFSAVRERLTMLGSRWGAWRHRMKEYGAATVLLSAVTRRLGPARLDRRLQRRIRHIDSEGVRLESLGLNAPSAHLGPLSTRSRPAKVQSEGAALGHEAGRRA